MLTTLSSCCSPWAVVRFFLLSTFENSFLTMKNSYHKALVPSRRVNYYKHVQFDLRDNITSRDVTKKVRICMQNMQQGPDVRVTLLKIRSWKPLEMAISTWDVQEKKDHSIGQWISPSFPILYKTPPKVKVEECCQSHLDSPLNGIICVRSPVINESEWIWPGPYHANTAISPLLAARLLIIKKKTSKKTNTHF